MGQVSGLLVVAGVACLLTARRGERPSSHSAAWAACGLVAVGLGLAAFFSLDMEFIHLLRAVGWRLGWYTERRQLQEPVIVLVALAAAIGAVVFLVRSPAWPGALRIALCASVGLLTLSAVWGISFHDTDALLRRDVAGQASGAVLADVGALVLGGAALWERNSRRER